LTTIIWQPSVPN